MTQSQYTSLYGPTVGDSVRLETQTFSHKLKKTMLISVMKLLSVVVNQFAMAWRKIRM